MWITHRAGRLPPVVHPASPVANPFGNRATVVENRRTTGAVNRPVHSPATAHPGVRRIYNGIDVELGDVTFDDADPRHVTIVRPGSDGFVDEMPGIGWSTAVANLY